MVNDLHGEMLKVCTSLCGYNDAKGIGIIREIICCDNKYVMFMNGIIMQCMSKLMNRWMVYMYVMHEFIIGEMRDSMVV